MAEFKLIDDTIKLIAALEGGYKLIAYPDVTGYAIGYGSHKHLDGRNVNKGDEITKEQADQLLKQRVENEFFPHAKRILKHADINDYQAGAVTSLIYNTGEDNITSNRSLIKAINEKPDDYDKIKKLFAEWRLDANGEVREGLCRRRAIEAYFYEHGKINMNVPYDYNPNLGGYETNSESDAVVGNSKNETKYINTNYCASIKCPTEPEPVVGNGENYGEDISQINNAGRNYSNLSAIKILCNMDKSYKLSIISIEPKTYADFFLFSWDIKDILNEEKVGELLLSMHEDYKKVILTPNVKDDIIQGIANKINAQYRDTGPKIEINFKSYLEDDQYKLLKGWLQNNRLNKDDTMINNGDYDATEKFILRCMRYVDMEGSIAGMEEVLFKNNIISDISGKFTQSRPMTNNAKILCDFMDDNPKDIKHACEQFFVKTRGKGVSGSIYKYNITLNLGIDSYANCIKRNLKINGDEHVLKLLGYRKAPTGTEECDIVIILVYSNEKMRLINYLKL